MAKKKVLTAAQRRFVWLLDNLYGGNRAEMVRRTGVSMTGIIKIVTGEQDAGRRILEKLAANTAANAAWLLTGEGPPLRGSGLPVADVCLPGAPDRHRELLAADKVTEADGLYSPTRYWLRLSPREWAVLPASRKLAADTALDSETKLAAGDLMLMETDRKKFPTAERLGGRWCALRPGGRPARLARLDYTPPSGDGEPGVLEAETFRARLPKARRIVIDALPDGEYRVTETEFAAREHRSAAGSRAAPEVPPLPAGIRPDDVVAVCVLLVRRFGVGTE